MATGTLPATTSANIRNPPIEQRPVFERAVNLNTAVAPGLALTPRLLVDANAVID
ncbi:MAG: hypothetical protein U1E21_18505 [Reyranellaceae bacterium]